MVKKWFKYTIDYEYGTGQLFSRERLDRPESTFSWLGGQCFGLRKSIGEMKLLDEELVAFDGSASTVKHSDVNVMNMGMGTLLGTLLHAATNQEGEFEIPSQLFGRVAYVLTHGQDVIAFSANKYDGDYWKLVNEYGDPCTCNEEGKPELACEVHHFWVPNHDKKCKCNKR